MKNRKTLLVVILAFGFMYGLIYLINWLRDIPISFDEATQIISGFILVGIIAFLFSWLIDVLIE